MEKVSLVPEFRYVQTGFVWVVDRLLKVKGQLSGRGEVFNEGAKDTQGIEKYILKGLEQPPNKQHENGSMTRVISLFKRFNQPPQEASLYSKPIGSRQQI